MTTHVVDTDTGEVVDRAPAVRAPGPMTVVDVAAQCRSVEVWAEHCDSIDELREADHRLAAIGEYVKRTSTEGRAKVEAARRRLELRIGQLLGPTTPGQRHDQEPSLANEGSDDLTPNERSQFRKMADHPDVVDAVIDDSTDATPASRRRVLDEIGKAKHTPEPVDIREARERAEADQRAAARIVAAVATLTRFASTDRRAEVLALLPVETVDVLEAITATLTVATQEQAS